MKSKKNKKSIRKRNNRKKKKSKINRLVISINPERRKYLNYNYTLIPGETKASPFVKKNMIQKYNENKKSKRYKGKCGCFTSQMKALQYAVDHKIKKYYYSRR